MSMKLELENKRDQDLRITCIDMATKVVGKSIYLNKEGNQYEKHHDNVVEVATQIYNFVTSQ